MAQKEIQAFRGENDLKKYLAENYIRQITNFFGDEKRALKFLSSVVADTQRNPKLLECTPTSLVNSYITMAQLGFMPSNVSGESYVLPYQNTKKIGDKFVKVMEAQFQMGYQGLVTLFYQAGVEKITSEIVRKNDKTSFVDGVLRHEIDLTLSNEERGEPVGAYVRITFRGVDNVKYMNAKDILAHGAKFSKSYDPKGKYSPWNPDNDPELHMWRKTVLKQLAKNVPKNENINRAIALDNKDSIIADRLEPATEASKALTMGNLVKNGENKKTKDAQGSEESQDGATDAESPQGSFEENTEQRD